MSDQQQQSYKVFRNSLESIAKLYRDTRTADVHFTFESDDGTETRVDAHKSLLAATSDVFGAMFYGELKETGDIPVIDATDAAFKEFLQYFYQDEIKLTIGNAVEVMYLAHKYNVPKCVEDCIEFLKLSLANENVCAVLFYSILYNHMELLKLCEKHIIVNTEAVLKTAGFLKCDRKVLAHILQMDFLSCSEVEVFKACMAWVEAKYSRHGSSKEIVETHLGDLFYKIRFASMTIQQLCALQQEYDTVLSSDFITIANIVAGSQIQIDKFVTVPRQIKWDEDAIIKCDRKSNGRLYPFDLYSEYKTTLSTNAPLILGSFICGKIVMADGFGGHDLDWDLTVDVKIIETHTSDSEYKKTLLNMKVNLKSTMTAVSLTQAILIRPGFFYSICLGPFPGDHQYCAQVTKGKIKLDRDTIVEIREDNYIEEEEGEDDDDNDLASFGLIPELNFNKI